MFYNEVKKRVEVPITKELKEKVEKLVLEMQEFYARRYTPKVKTGKHCLNCSLQHICLPDMMNRQSVKSYIERSEEHTSELQSRGHLVCRLLLEKKKNIITKRP